MRYERKYILTSEEAVALENVIRLHPCGLSHHYPTRQVNNIYFDSLQGNYNSQNLDGINIRQKCRWRWYGERLQSDVQIFQEIKSKHNLLGEKSKTLIRLKNTNQQNFISIANELLLENNLFAVLYNSYCRQYWQSFDMKISLTTDTDMLFGNPKTGWLNLQTTI
ncbi:MAG: VTC domain-containing protein, partial [Saprospiraceae bacterium]